MAVVVQRLLRTSKPKADESFMGYIIRLTERNGYESPSWILEMAELNCGASSPSCSFSFGASERFNLLAKLTDTNISELLSITYPLANVEHDYCLFFDNIIPRYCLRLGRPKICPECLLESSYCRRIWDLSIVTTCLKHKCLLLDECANCESFISWSRNHVSICSCEFDWRKSTPISVGASELSLTQHIHWLCGLPIDKDYTQDRLHQNPVLNLSLQDLLLTVFFIAGQYQGLLVSTSKNLIPFGRNKDFHNLFSLAFSVFEDWPNAYYQFLDWRSKQEKCIPYIRQRQKSILYREFGRFYAGLFKILSECQFGFMKKAFVEYLIERWEGYCVLPASKKNNITPHFENKYISKIDAERLLEIFDGQIDQLIKIGKLKSIVRSKGMKRLIFVDVADIAKLMRETVE